MARLCSIEKCETTSRIRGMCRKHYDKARRTNAPLPVPLLQVRTVASPVDRLWDKVNKNAPNGCWEWAEKPTTHGYGRLNVNGRMVLAHRFAYELLVGPIPQGKHLDHLCHNAICVNPGHLRQVDHQKNMWNRKGASRHSRTGVRGVYPSRGKFRATVQHRGRIYRLGTFDSVAEAELIVSRKRAELEPVPVIAAG